MKNSLLATAVASTLLLASSAHAFTGKIEFTGKLVDKNPYWSISIPAKSIQDAKGWQSKLTDGKAIKGDKTEFSFKKNIPFVQGYMNKALEKKTGTNGKLLTVGIEPIVTIAGHKLNWRENNETGDTPLELSVKIRGQAHGSDIKDGELNFTLSDGFVYFAADRKNSILLVNRGSTPQQQKASALLQLTADMLTRVYSQFNYSQQTTIENSSYSASAHNFVNYDAYAGAFMTELSDFKATFDNNAIPEKWTASIPVTISYK